MSGRPYARNPRAPYAGPRDLEAVLPHTFRLDAPLKLRDAKHEAIRRAIRRRCMQKNWRKMISIRHRRLTGEAAENDVKEKPQEQKTKEAEEAKEEPIDAAEETRKQLQQLEEKLQGLTDQKHAKFQLLKDILVQEARSKMTGGAAPTVAKKRRVEFKDRVMTPSPAKMQSPVPHTDGNAASAAVAMGAGNDAAPGSAEKA